MILERESKSSRDACIELINTLHYMHNLIEQFVNSKIKKNDLIFLKI